MWSAPEGNRWIPLLCSINSTPHGQPLCRAYTLTRKKEYLEYAVRTTLNSVGANPQNMTFTTKLGHRYPEFPLQCNRYYMHQPEPYAGYTVYGLHDQRPPWWVTQWMVTPKNSAPEIGKWPIAESYWDVESWPMVNENTVHQSMAPAVYGWGYLAARP
jgi:endoglucanase